MLAEVPIGPQSIASFTIGNRDVKIPGHYSPVRHGAHLAHELGHRIHRNQRFKRAKFLSPAEINTTTLPLSEPRRRMFFDLFRENKRHDASWRDDVTDLVYQAILLITQSTFDPNHPLAVNLQIIEEDRFKKMTANMAFPASGIIYNEKNELVAVATPRGYATEVPAYYTQLGVAIILEHTLTTDPKDPARLGLPETYLPSHLLAHRTALSLLRRETFPTSKVIHQEWLKYLNSA